MIDINWVSFLLGFITAAILLNIAQIIIAYYKRKKAKEQMSRMGKRLDDLKEKFKSDTSSFVNAIREKK